MRGNYIMIMNVEIKIVPFGQMRLEIGKPPIEESQAVLIREAVRYYEPQETASRIYEIQYRENFTNCIVPLSTV
jgi:hypothetical protein